ncbi:MAG: DUF4221 family protein [Bacteroidaceae bacterium]|nr:DUF4221 family protein [Bacteroidaceae bacterium]
MKKNTRAVICLLNLVDMKYCLLLLVAVIFSACSEQVEPEDKYVLRPIDEYLEYKIDDDTRVPLYSLYTFAERGVEYLTFSDPSSRTILIYDLHSCQQVKKIPFDREGPNGIGPVLFGFYVKDFDHIYIPSVNESFIYLTDTTGVLRNKIDFSCTEDGLKTKSAHYTNLNYGQLTFMGESLYIPQVLNTSLGERMVEESPIGVLVDTIIGKTTRFPMNYPYVIPYNQRHEAIHGTMESTQIYDGKNLIVAFNKDEKLYKVDKQGKVETFPAKSRYLPRLKFPKFPEDFSQTLKKTCETAEYRNVFYDKYRNVYYRFVSLEAELASNENYHKILHAGKVDFSIMILDENFNILGETRFPAFTYVPHICFINKDGLYLSTSHFKREDYSDDVLRFQRIELVKK